MAGALFVVATPIGNLEDLTFRALRTLREVDVIAAEDTRRTAKLLAHYQVQKPLVSLREHNEVREAPRLVARIAAGENIALVSDAGTPGIADPGARLVRAAREAGLKVVPIPGASAVAAALSASGYPASEFVFLGFPPSSGQARAAWFRRLEDEARVAVLFEAPHRISRAMEDLGHVSAVRPITVFREITKIHEESVEYTTNNWPGSLSERGEFTIVVGPAPSPVKPVDQSTGWEPRAVALFGHLTATNRPSRDQALDIVAEALNLDRLALKKAVKRQIMSGK